MKLKDTSIKSLPLGVGLAISIILVAKICFELSYDRCYRDSQNIYQIRTGFNQQGHELDYSGVSGGVAPGFRQYVRVWNLLHEQHSSWKATVSRMRMAMSYQVASSSPTLHISMSFRPRFLPEIPR